MTIGLEWKPARANPVSLSRSQLIGVTMLSSATENIATVVPRIVNSSGSPVQIGCDIYDLANPMNDTQHWSMVLPTSNAANGIGWSKKSGSTVSAYDANAYTFINEISSTADPTAFQALDNRALIYTGLAAGASTSYVMFHGSGTVYDGDTGVSGATLSGQRVSAVEVVVVTHGQDEGGTTIDGALQIGGTRYGSDYGSFLVQKGTGFQRLRFRWNTNPATGHQWTAADAVALTDNVTDRFGVGIISKKQTGTFAVHSVAIQFLCQTERRIRVGYATAPPSSSSWLPFTMVSPDAEVTAAWPKVSAHTYAVVFYLTGTGGTAALSAMDSANVAGHSTDTLTGWTGLLVPSYNLVRSAAESAWTWAPSMLMITSGATTSPDVQPYIISAGTAVGAGTNRQTMTMTGTFGGITTVLRATAPTADLTITVGSQTATVTAAEVPSDGQFHLVTTRLGATATNPAFIGFSSAGTGWEVILSSVGATGESGYTSTAATASSSGSATWAGTALTFSDVIATIQTVPTAPTSLTATLGSRTNTTAPCGPTTIKHAHLDWSDTSLGALFSAYELQRRNPDGVTWDTIAFVTAEAQSVWNDQGARRGVVERYRVRVIRSDMAVSDWTATATITVTTDSTADWIFASNVLPNAAVAYQEDGDQMPRTFAPANANAAVTHLIEGSRYPTVFQPTEGRSDIFTVPLLIALDQGAVDPTVIGRAAFQPLLDLIQADEPPHIDVLDGRGNRWSASVLFVNGSQTWQMHKHSAPVQIIEVASAAVTTALPPVVT